MKKEDVELHLLFEMYLMLKRGKFVSQDMKEVNEYLRKLSNGKMGGGDIRV